MNDLHFVLKQLFMAYPNSRIEEATVAVYVRLLSDIPPSELQTVVDQAIVECTFLPTVAELRQRHRALTHTLLAPTAADGWGEVEREIRRIGRYGTPHFDDPLTARVVAMMGWLNLCNSETPGVERAHFLRMYESLANRQESLDRLLPQARRLLVDSQAAYEANAPRGILSTLAGLLSGQPRKEETA